MKKLISIRSIPVLVLALLVVLGTALAAGKPKSVSGDVLTTNFAASNWSGTATLTIGGQNSNGALVYAQLVEHTPANEEGIIHAKFTHSFFEIGGVPENQLLTNDKVILEPTGIVGEYTLRGKMTITSGWGIFSGATGRLNMRGTVTNWPLSESPATVADFDVQGSISY